MTDLGPRQFCSDTFATFLAEAGAIINSTPLTAISTNPDDPKPLSPAMLLTMKSDPHPQIPDHFEAPDVYSRKRWKQTQFLANEFWKRWSCEYLQTQQQRVKWTRTTHQLHTGDIVLVEFGASEHVESCKDSGTNRQ